MQLPVPTVTHLEELPLRKLLQASGSDSGLDGSSGETFTNSSNITSRSSGSGSGSSGTSSNSGRGSSGQSGSGSGSVSGSGSGSLKPTLRPTLAPKIGAGVGGPGSPQRGSDDEQGMATSLTSVTKTSATVQLAVPSLLVLAALSAMLL
jgi:hypothetical protein